MIWQKVKLGDVCTIEKGTIGILKATPGIYPMVVTGEERKSHHEYQFDDEAVIIPLVSSTGHGHKSLKRIHFQTGKFALGSILCAVIPKNKTLLSAEYLYRLLDLNKDAELVARMRGSANVSLPIKEIAQIKIPLPPLAQQHAFVHFYKKLENQCNTLNVEFAYQLEVVKKLRQQFLQEAIQGKLVPNEPNESAKALLQQIKTQKGTAKKEKALPPIKNEEIPFEIPVNWVWCRLRDICVKIGSGSTPNGSNYSKVGIPFFRSQNIYNENLVYDDIKFISNEVHHQMRGTVVYANDILLNITGGSMGRCALVPLDFREGNVSQHVCIIRFDQVVSQFYHYLILSPFFQEYIFSSTTGAGREGLPKVNLEKFLIPLPPLSEQVRIVAQLEKLMALCADLESSIRASKAQNEQFLQKVLQEALQPSE